MFIGHYGIALAAKRADRSISAGTLFFAAQFSDMLFMILVLLGVERMSFAPGITAVSPLDFTYYPFSHGLAANLLWAGLFYLIVKFLPAKSGADKSRTALVTALVVLSHFVLDVVTHRPDMPLLGGGSLKIGLGLWNYAGISTAVELVMFFGGLWMYLSSTRGATFGGKYGMAIFAVLQAAFFSASLLAPPPADFNIMGFAVFGLLYQVIVIGIVTWLDRKRTARG